MCTIPRAGQVSNGRDTLFRNNVRHELLYPMENIYTDALNNFNTFRCRFWNYWYQPRIWFFSRNLRSLSSLCSSNYNSFLLCFIVPLSWRIVGSVASMSLIKWIGNILLYLKQWYILDIDLYYFTILCLRHTQALRNLTINTLVSRKNPHLSTFPPHTLHKHKIIN